MTKDEQEVKVCQDRSLIIQDFLKKSLEFYSKKNKTLPRQIAVYRDGVGGPSYHSKVITNEVEDITHLLSNYSPNYNPQILYTLVDKRINTRFTEKRGDQYENPAPGTVVD